MRTVLLLPLGAWLTSACVYTGATMLNATATRSAICPEAVQLFTGADKVSGEYEEVAVLTSRGDADLTSEEGMVKSQRKKAAKLGANGIILGDPKDPSTGARVAHALLGTAAARKGKAVAIYIPGDSTRVRDACASTPAAKAQRT
jgi:hypothetical protein